MSEIIFSLKAREYCFLRRVFVGVISRLHTQVLLVTHGLTRAMTDMFEIDNRAKRGDFFSEIMIKL